MTRTNDKISADNFVAQLIKLRSDEQVEKNRRYFKNADVDEFIGIKMGSIFDPQSETKDGRVMNRWPQLPKRS